MIIHHPTKNGWLIVTPEVQRLLTAPHKLVLPDGTQVNNLHFREIDFVEDDIDDVKEYALSYVRQAANNTEDNFDDRITGWVG